jgi:hypothetical protein
LVPHPDTPASSVSSIVVDVARKGAALALSYRLTGRIADLAIPSPADPARADELWKHTCFEAFVRPEPGEAYLELNFAPSSQWAAYRFDGYRAGMAPAIVAAPRIALRTSADMLDLQVALTLPELASPSRLALSAVIEQSAGAKSYWALAHPPGRPDFHHTAGFLARL